jgi:DNA-binding NarL/FixJ family response regulator
VSEILPISPERLSVPQSGAEMASSWRELGHRLVRESRLFALLSPVEREVAMQIGLGLTNKEIAAVLKKSPATVKAQVASILDKLEFPTRCRLIVWLHEQNTRALLS